MMEMQTRLGPTGPHITMTSDVVPRAEYDAVMEQLRRTRSLLESQGRILANAADFVVAETVTPLRTAEAKLAKLRKLHWAYLPNHMDEDVCATCQQLWPCQTIRILDEEPLP